MREPVVVTVIAAPHWGGLHGVVERTTPFVRRAGFERIVVCPATDQMRSRLGAAGAEVIDVNLSRMRKSVNLRHHLGYVRSFFADVSRIEDILRRRRADLVEVVGLLNLQPVLAARRLGLPVIWQLHSTLCPQPLRSVLGAVAARTAAVVMTSGEGMIARHGGLRDSKAPIVPFCAPLTAGEFAPRPADRAKARAAWGYDEQDIVVGTLGNRGWQKRHEMLVKIAARLRGANARLKFAIVGSPLQTQSRYYDREVLARIEAGGLSDGGYVRVIDQDRPAAELMNAFDVFALTSSAEGASLVTAEAMATGLPILSTDVGSLSDIVRPGENGRLVPVDDIDGAAKAILELCDDEVRGVMGANSLERVERLVSADKCAQAHVTAYRMALSLNRRD